MLSVQTEWFSTNKSKKILLISSMYEIKKSSDKATLETENKHLDITKLWVGITNNWLCDI